MIAFGTELTPRLDVNHRTRTSATLITPFMHIFPHVQPSPPFSGLQVNHRIRSTKLTAEELATLRAPPFVSFVDQSALQIFQ